MFEWFNDPKVRLHFRQGSRFAISGVLGATMEFSILGVLIGHYHISPFISYIFSAGIPAVFVFCFNKYITFHSIGDKTTDQTVRFLMVYSVALLLNYALSALFFTIGSHYFLDYVIAGFQLKHDYIAYGAKALAIGVTAVWNYIFSHYFIFRKTEVPVEAEMAGFI
jgi:putative flippase GtrA